MNLDKCKERLKENVSYEFLKQTPLKKIEILKKTNSYVVIKNNRDYKVENGVYVRQYDDMKGVFNINKNENDICCYRKGTYIKFISFAEIINEEQYKIIDLDGLFEWFSKDLELFSFLGMGD